MPALVDHTTHGPSTGRPLNNNNCNPAAINYQHQLLPFIAVVADPLPCYLVDYKPPPVGSAISRKQTIVKMVRGNGLWSPRRLDRATFHVVFGRCLVAGNVQERYAVQCLSSVWWDSCVSIWNGLLGSYLNNLLVRRRDPISSYTSTQRRSSNEEVPWTFGEPPHLFYFVIRLVQLFLFLPEKKKFL